MKILKLLFLFISLSLMSCSVTKSAYKSGDYDTVVDKMTEKASKSALDAEQVEILAASYHQANENDFKRIMELKMSGQPDIWLEIYQRTVSIDKRQKKMKPLSDELKNAIAFKPLDLDAEIVNAKSKAETFLSAKANHLLKEPVEENVRQAEVLVNQLYKLNSTNRNLDDLRLKLVILPSERILFRVATPVDLNMPEDFAKLALDFDDNTIYGVPFDIVPIDGTQYDLMIRIMIEERKVTPDRIDAVTFKENNGGFIAEVTDKSMTKSAMIKGQIEFVDMKNEKILLCTPFDVTSKFVHHYAEVSGDKRACSEHTMQLMNQKAVDFPSDMSLLRDTARKLNAIIKEHYQKK